MKIRILQNFDCYERGQVFEDWAGGMCDILIRRGLIEEVETAEAVPETVERAEVSVKHTPKRKR